MGVRVTEQEVKDRINKVSGNKYGFDNFHYTKMHDHTFLTCYIHGDFKITPHKALAGRGCRVCSDYEKSLKFKRTYESFVRDSRKVNGNKYKYKGFTTITNNNTPIQFFCRACNKIVKQRIHEHLQGKNHRGCSLIPKRKRKKNSGAAIRDLKKSNRIKMNEWSYALDWDEKTITDGSYVGFVYQFKFEDGSHYIGVKQMWKKIKTAKKLNGDEVSNGWEDYSSSSRIVNQKIANGENYTRTILYAFPTMDEAMLVELSLILSEGLKYGSLNLATMHKCKLPNAEGKKRVYGILQELWEYLN